MTRKPSTTWDTKPHKPIFYGPLARLADRFAGVSNGNAAIPDVPAGRRKPLTPRPRRLLTWRSAAVTSGTAANVNTATC